MKQNFGYCLKEVLKSEGGYTNDPHDPGGPTNFGITIHDYRAYINHEGTAEDVRNMTVEQAGTIYKEKYWDAVSGDTLPSGVDYCVFDYGVNSGVGRANTVVHHVGQDIDKICNERLRFLKGLRTWKYYGRGWSSRVAHVRTYSHILAGRVLAKPCLTTPITSSPQQPRQSWITFLSQWISKALPSSWRPM